jgi:hypothetical protein
LNGQPEFHPHDPSPRRYKIVNSKLTDFLRRLDEFHLKINIDFTANSNDVIWEIFDTQICEHVQRMHMLLPPSPTAGSDLREYAKLSWKFLMGGNKSAGTQPLKDLGAPGYDITVTRLIAAANKIINPLESRHMLFICMLTYPL